MGKVHKSAGKLHIGGVKGRHTMERIEALNIGDEIAGGVVTLLLQFSKYKCFILTETEDYWNIHFYNSNTKKTRTFKGKTYPRPLFTWKILHKVDYEFNEIISIIEDKLNELRK